MLRSRLPRLATSAIKPNMTRALSASAASKNAKAERPLYAYQSEIPHLPVPRLASTLHKYLESLLPLQTREEHAASSKIVREFAESDFSHVLQARLQARADERPSWLSDWWNEDAYMGYRDRIVPNVNYFYTHKRGIGKGASQTERAAQIVRAVVEFKKLVDSEKLAPEMVKGKPLCMASYKYIFNASRIPTSPSDIPLAYPKDLNNIIVLRNSRYFKLDVGGRSASEIAAALEQIKQTADKAPGSDIGVLTVDNRDVWTEFRRHLISVSDKNTTALQDIESAILIICLDDGAAPSNDTARAWQYWAGGLDPSANGKGRNRWYDKHQFIIDEAGEAGFNGEHSMLDGTPTLRLQEFVLGSLEKGVIPLELPANERASGALAPTEIEFVLDAKLKDAIAQSKKGFAEEMAKWDLKMVTFDKYGKNEIKKYKVSPDAYVQMIKQLAFWKHKGRPGICYESCQTRRFLLGRTEVIRSASSESRAFCEAMSDPARSDAERAALLRTAAARHSQYSAWAADAQGVDRHLYGLKKEVRDDETLPAIFNDPFYSRSSHWELSTSNLGSKFLDGWGYGAVVHDGYGLSYGIHDDKVQWGITTLNGDAEKFAGHLQEAAVEVRDMLERAAQQEKAKL